MLRFSILAGGALLVADDQDMTTGRLLGLLTAMAGLGGDFTSLAKHTMSLIKARPSLQRIYRFLDREPLEEGWSPALPVQQQQPQPAPHLWKSKRRRRRRRTTVSRAELLLSRMDADPIVRVSNLEFGYADMVDMDHLEKERRTAEANHPFQCVHPHLRCSASSLTWRGCGY